MQFVINASLEPFGCALIQDGAVVDISLWDDFRKVGEASWEFLDQHKDIWSEIDHIGGVSGPGGFSNLRVAGVILNALSLRLDLPVHQVRADRVVSHLLDGQGIEAPFLLNSFGDAVFEVQGDRLIRLSIEEVKEKYGEKEVCVDFLPQAKRQNFSNIISLDTKALYPALGEVLKHSESQNTFIPDYEYPAVQQ